MRLVFIAATFLLLLLLSGTEAKAVSKRHVRRDWLIYTDAAAFFIYESVNKLSPPAGKFLMDLFETPLVQNTRSLLIKQTSQLSLKAEELYNKVFELWQKKESGN